MVIKATVSSARCTVVGSSSPVRNVHGKAGLESPVFWQAFWQVLGGTSSFCCSAGFPGQGLGPGFGQMVVARDRSDATVSCGINFHPCARPQCCVYIVGYLANG